MQWSAIRKFLRPLHRSLGVEGLEPRCLLSTQPVEFGAVFVEEDLGSDLHGDSIYITFRGGPAATQLRRLVIDTDQEEPGLGDGDLLFDVDPGGLGADEAYPLTILNREGIDSINVTVQDGGTRLILDFEGFDAGERLVLSVDVDEAEDIERGGTLEEKNGGIDPITSGVEFQGSILTASFTAPDYHDLTASTTFLNAYDAQLAPTQLDLPPDNTGGKRDRTAGGVGQDRLQPRLASLAGHVYHDLDNNGRRSPAEPGLAGVQVRLVPISTVEPQEAITVVTDAQGGYRFEGIMPGTYRLVETQPGGYWDGIDRAGTVNGQPVGMAVNPGDQIDQIRLAGGQQGVDYDFGEIQPVGVSGHVHRTGPDGDCLDDGEPGSGLAGVAIELRDAVGVVVATTVTGPDGSYRFQDLPPGTYTVVEVPPQGYFDAGIHVGMVNGVEVGVIGEHRVTGIGLLSGQEGVHYDFCHSPPASISGYVYHDRDRSGRRQGEEEGIGQVVVRLLREDGSEVAKETTDAQGRFRFQGLRAGTYTIVEGQPEGWQDGEDRAGTLDGVPLGRAVNPGDRIEEITVGWGQDSIDNLFGEWRWGSLEGSVCLSDAQGNCFGSNVEHQPLPGVSVELLDAEGRVIRTTETDSQGRYTFDQLPPGEYAIREITPPGLIDGDSHPGGVEDRTIGQSAGPSLITAIHLGSGDLAREYIFCEHAPSSLSGFVYHDQDRDGRREDEEPPLAGVWVVLLDGEGIELARMQTDAHGAYAFSGLRGGAYQVRELQPDGWLDGAEQLGRVGGVVRGTVHPSGDRFDLRLGWGETGVEYNFGEYLPGSLAGRVHVDQDADCIMDPGERPLGQVQIDLVDSAGRVVASTVTGADGRFRFDHLPPGRYALRQHRVITMFHVGQVAGSGGGDDSVAYWISQIDVASGAALIDYVFCEEEPVRIAGYVFQDGPEIVLAPGESPPEDVAALRDGQRTADDAPLPGVRLELRNGITGQPIYGRDALDGRYPPNEPIWTETDANGHYEFTGLRKGNYAIYETQPAAWIDGIDTPGTLSGIAINRHEPVPEQLLAPLVKAPNFDAILRIAAPPGAESDENNFSEVRVRPTRIVLFEPREPTPIPAAAGPELPAIPPRPPVILLPPNNGLRQRPLPRVARVIGYTWHLSLVDGGFPRGPVGPMSGESVVLDSQQVGPAAWGQEMVQGGEWVMVVHGPTRTMVHDCFGCRDARVLAGDFNGDGLDEVAVFADGQWFIDFNANGMWDEGDLWARLGHRGDLPVTGDWDGDGKDDIGIFGPAWPGDPRAVSAEPGLPDLANAAHGKPKNLPPAQGEATHGRRILQFTRHGDPRADVIDHVFYFGTAGDHPVIGDWNGDGIASVGIFRDGHWYLDVDGDGRWSLPDRYYQYGDHGDTPIVGDFNGDGIDEIGIYRDGRIYVDRNRNGRLEEAERVQTDLADQGVPVVGDWDGDGVDEVAMYVAGHLEGPRTARK